MNKIFIIGNLTRYRNPHNTIRRFGVLVLCRGIPKVSVNGEKVTDFFTVNAWRQLGENCQKFLAKGKKVSVIGELQPRPYTAKDGTTRVSLDVSADEVEFLSPNGESTPTAGLEGFESIPESDLPF